MKDDGKVVALVPGKPDTLAAAIAEMRERLPGRIEYQRIMAKLQREAYLAYLAEGFTPAQALALCKELKL